MRTFLAALFLASSSAAHAGLALAPTGAPASCPVATFNGSTSYGQSAALSALGSVNPVSVSFWANLPSFDTNDELIMALSSDPTADTNTGVFAVDPNSGSIFRTYIQGAPGEFVQAQFSRPSAAAWHSYLFVYNMALTPNGQVVASYIDGVAQTYTPIGNSSATTFFGYPLYLMSLGGASLFEAGDLARVAIWTSDLSSGDATSLAGGASPTTIEGGPAYYWYLTGTAGTEANHGSGGTAAMTLTNVGTTTSGPSPCPTE